jgi:Tol biopolymer transport system component
VLSSCPVSHTDRLAWLTSGRFLRVLAPIAGLALVVGVIYNASTVDRMPPSFQISLSATAPDSDLAMTLSSVNVVFNEQVRHETAEAAFSITPYVAGSFHWQGATLIFTPSDKLPLSSTFTVRVDVGVQDLAGNYQGDAKELTFATVGSPAVASILPAGKAEGVPIESDIEITFDRLMDTQKVLDGLRIEPSVSFRATWNGPTLTVQPVLPLAYSTVYYVKIGDPAIDTDGTRLPAFISTFKTVERGLNATHLVPAPNTVGVSVRTPIAVSFDGPVDPASIAGAIRLSPEVGGSIRIAAPSVETPPPASPAEDETPPPVLDGDQVLVFTPDRPLEAHTTYTATLSASVRRSDGKAGAQQTWTFTTGEAATTALNHIAFLSDRSGVANVWMMNPDGSNQRQVTAEITPVVGFDVSGDGTAIAYGTGGVVKRMAIGGDNLQVITADGSFDYGAAFTPDGTALIVARRDGAGIDRGYWRMPIVSGADPRQITADGAPIPDGAAAAAGFEGGQIGDSRWAPRVAVSSDGLTALLVRGLDDTLQLVDMSGATDPLSLSMIGNSRPIWSDVRKAFYVVATADDGLTWAYWEVTVDGEVTRLGSAAGDMAGDVEGCLAFVVRAADGSTHMDYVPAGGGATSLLTSDAIWSEASPSFSPDGSMIVFSRFGFHNPSVSGGIWVVRPNGTGLMNLSTDGCHPHWLP